MMCLKGHKLIALLCFAMQFPSAQASTGMPDQTTLRCVYQNMAEAGGAAAIAINAGPLRGTWRHAGHTNWSYFFSTAEAPVTLRIRCEDMKPAHAGEFVEARAWDWEGLVHAPYQIWYERPEHTHEAMDRVVSFGDSLSDTGNMNLATHGLLGWLDSDWMLPGPSWFAGRFSNGLVWTEYLARRNGLVHNSWAVGGSESVDSYHLINGIESQVESFIANMHSMPSYDPSRTLFTFLIGANDFANDTRSARRTLVRQRSAIEKLIDHGARKIMIANLPDLTRAPVFRMGRQDQATVNQMVEAYNLGLIDMIRQVKTYATMKGIHDVQIHLFDVHRRFDGLLTNPYEYGFINVTEPCLDIQSASTLAYLQHHALRPGCHPDSNVFWDTFHPTTRVHELMSLWARERAPLEWRLR